MTKSVKESLIYRKKYYAFQVAMFKQCPGFRHMKTVVFNLFEHDEHLCSFASFCRTQLFPIQQKIKVGYWNAINQQFIF